MEQEKNHLEIKLNFQDQQKEIQASEKRLSKFKQDDFSAVAKTAGKNCENELKTCFSGQESSIKRNINQGFKIQSSQLNEKLDD